MNQPGQFGSLFLLFLVVLPEVVTPEQIKRLQDIWPQQVPKFSDSEVTKVDMVALTEEEDMGAESADEEQAQEGPTCVSQ